MTQNLWNLIQNYAPTIATIFFFLFFCNVVYSLFKKGQEQKFNDYAKIPLNENQDEETTLQSNDNKDSNLTTPSSNKHNN